MGMLVGGGDSHDSNIAPLGEQFDPTSWIVKMTGAPKQLNPHTFIKPGTDKLNEWISPVTKPINEFHRKYEPVNRYLDQNVPLFHQWNETIENRPVDAAAIAAAMYFGGSALASGMGSGGASAGATSNGGMFGTSGQSFFSNPQNWQMINSLSQQLLNNPNGYQ